MIVLKILGIVVLVLVVLYLLLIMPRMINRPDITPFMGRLYAHRGLHDNKSEAPENTMPAFRKAIEKGYGIELDIQLTKDDVIVVCHDFDLKRVCGADVKIKDLTYEELQQYKICDSNETVPKFSDFLKLVDGQVPLIIEYKSEDFNTKLFEMGDAMLREYKGVYCVESFNPLLVLWYRRHHNDIVRGILSDSYVKEGFHAFPKWGYFVLHNLLTNGIAKPDFIAYHHIY
ncbi:MAG: glycerophosphodiester phosphodiesterase family protein, partial [Pararoseburia sp.]|nr:glycerophosphodiester phosphodiesterase family protein [Pararoseburia sp.]